jgi:hypothetical protein
MIQGVIQLLVNASAVKTAVGLNKAEDRYKIYPVFADSDEVPPFSVARITGNKPTQFKDGSSIVDKISFQVVTYATEYEQLDGIDTAMRFIMDGYKGISAGIDMVVSLQNQSDSGVEGKAYMARISEYEAFVVRTPSI